MFRYSRLLLLAFLLLATTNLLAQTNLQAHLFASTADRPIVTSVPVGMTVTFDAEYTWNGGVVPANVALDIEVPGEILAVLPDSGDVQCSGGAPVHCTIHATSRSQSGHVIVVAKQRTAGSFTPKATISTTTPGDPAFDNVATRELTVLDRASLSVQGFMAPQHLPPGGPGFIEASVLNLGLAANNVRVELTLPDGGTFRSATALSHGGTCTVQPNRAICTAEVLPYLETFRVRADFTTPDITAGGIVTSHVDVSSFPNDHDPGDNSASFAASVLPHYLVTTTRDTGSGSLREAIIDAGANCTTQPCVIGFRIRGPVPESGWFTIQPRTPLPEVTGWVSILGATQTAFTGDTNPDGPEIEINGSLLPEGTNGLQLGRGCGMDVFDLAINGFPRHAIEATRVQENCPPGGRNPTTAIARNYLGTDPRGRTAVPNERGIVLLSGSVTTITDNVISGNRRAGIFAWKGFYAYIGRNKIGVNALGEPLGNGASGMFLNLDEAESYPPGGADVEDNIIANNLEWGIARTKAGEVSIRNNKIYDNMFFGIDVNLDFETPNREDDISAGSQPNRPTLFFAFYDAARDVTVVRGEFASRQIIGGHWRIDVYASTNLSGWRQPQGEQLVASEDPISPGKFEIAVRGDWRGKWITATNSRTRVVGFSHLSAVPSDTSEFSNAVLVP